MILAKVCGQLTSTINHPFYNGKRLLIVERMLPDGSFSGSYLVAVDAIGAGASETVLILDEGNSARQIAGDNTAPLRSIVVAIVDALDLPKP